MQSLFVLDFDGVLFNSAFEAFSVANKATEGRSGFRQDITYDEFLAFRSVITDAWQYNRLYSTDIAVPAASLRDVQPIEADWAFAQAFFEARKAMMEDPEWPKAMPPYDFFFLIHPLLLKHADRFAVLSTRNVRSIRETLAFHGADVVPVFGQEDIRRLGSKLAVAANQHWLDKGMYVVAYVDDMSVHLEPFLGQIHLPLHADWGYDTATAGSLSAYQIYTIISLLLSIEGQQQNEI